MFFDLRFGIDAAAGVIEINMLAVIKPHIICFTKLIDRFGFFVLWIFFEEGQKFIHGVVSCYLFVIESRALAFCGEAISNTISRLLTALACSASVGRKSIALAMTES